MSWSGHCTVELPADGSEETDAEVSARVADALNGIEIHGNDDCPEERKKAFRAAVFTAIGLVTSGAYGAPRTHAFYVTVAGHCNPGNEPRSGWSNDCVNISVTQKSPDG